VRGKNILLIDDILTTGATARAASQSLVRAGAATVFVATLARARRILNNLGAPLPLTQADASNQPVIDAQYASMQSSSSTHQSFSRGE
jgi:orotate phosphoribosyltransferase